MHRNERCGCPLPVLHFDFRIPSKIRQHMPAVELARFPSTSFLCLTTTSEGWGFGRSSSLATQGELRAFPHRSRCRSGAPRQGSRGRGTHQGFRAAASSKPGQRVWGPVARERGRALS